MEIMCSVGGVYSLQPRLIVIHETCLHTGCVSDLQAISFSGSDEWCRIIFSDKPTRCIPVGVYFNQTVCTSVQHAVLNQPPALFCSYIIYTSVVHLPINYIYSTCSLSLFHRPQLCEALRSTHVNTLGSVTAAADVRAS